MTEPRTLPKHMHYKHGAYYYVKNRRWIRVGTTIGEASLRISDIQNGRAEIAPPGTNGSDWLVKGFRVILSNSRGRAKKAGIEHTLTVADLQDLAKEARHCCAVTGILFSNERIGHAGTRPFFPSVDRKDSRAGYTKENCRLVCVVVNYAMNSWGQEILTKISVAHLKKLGYSVRQSNGTARPCYQMDS